MTIAYMKKITRRNQQQVWTNTHKKKKVSKIKDGAVEIIHYEEQEDKKNEEKQNSRGIWNTIKQNTQATQVLWETNKKIISLMIRGHSVQVFCSSSSR